MLILSDAMNKDQEVSLGSFLWQSSSRIYEVMVFSSSYSTLGLFKKYCDCSRSDSSTGCLDMHNLIQSLSHVQLFATPRTAACQASPSITNFQSILKLMSIESVMPFNHLILCHPLLLLPSIFPSIRVFSNESVFQIRWPKYWSFSFGINLSNE